VGIDLAAYPHNPSGVCVLTTKPHLSHAFTDDDLLTTISAHKPLVVAIDAPFSFPSKGPWRPCELALLKRGFRPLSPLLPSMKPLTERAMALVPEFRTSIGVKGQVIEVFARATEAILGIKRAGGSEHQWDAYLCALTGRAYIDGAYEAVDGIILPIAGIAMEERIGRG